MAKIVVFYESNLCNFYSLPYNELFHFHLVNNSLYLKCLPYNGDYGILDSVIEECLSTGLLTLDEGYTTKDCVRDSSEGMVCLYGPNKNPHVNLKVSVLLDSCDDLNIMGFSYMSAIFPEFILDTQEYIEEDGSFRVTEDLFVLKRTFNSIVHAQSNITQLYQDHLCVESVLNVRSLLYEDAFFEWCSTIYKEITERVGLKIELIDKGVVDYNSLSEVISYRDKCRGYFVYDKVKFNFFEGNGSRFTFNNFDFYNNLYRSAELRVFPCDNISEPKEMWHYLCVNLSNYDRYQDEYYLLGLTEDTLEYVGESEGAFIFNIKLNLSNNR